MTRKAKRFLALIPVMCIILACFCLSGCSGKVDPSQARHSTVYIEEGARTADGTWIPFASGSGFFIGKSGEKVKYLVTNHHVVADYLSLGAGQAISEYDNARAGVRVYFDNNDYLEASVVDSDSIKDIAILELTEPTDKRTPLKILPAEENMAGKNIHAIGYPGIVENELTTPIEDKSEKGASVKSSTIERVFTETGSGVKWIVIGADIMHGNSGGPIVNDEGAVVGLSEGGVTSTNVSASGAVETEQVKYAVNIAEVKAMLDKNAIPYELAGGEFPLLLVILIAGGAVLVIVIILIIVLVAGKKPPKPVQPPVGGQPPVGVQPGGVGGVVTPPVNANNGDSGYRIEGISGALSGKRVMVKTSGTVTIGRNASMCNVTVPDGTPGVSSRHCELWLNGNQVCIRDAGSSHGTFVSPGRKLAPNETAVLREGDQFWLGTEAQKFVIKVKRG